MKTSIFVRFRSPRISLSFFPAGTARAVARACFFLSLSLPRIPPIFFFCKREWDKLVNLYANGFDLELEADRGVTAVSAA